MKDAIADVVPSGFTDIGFIEPGHGLKGRKCWITIDADLIELYEQHNSKNCYNILLWCHEAIKNYPRKRSFSEISERKPAKKLSSSCAQILSEVKEIVDELQKKHGNSYSIEQLNCWAHMINSEKHDSTEVPPNLPYFKKPKHTTTITNASTISDSEHISTSERINLRSECMKQMESWHSLLEKGVVTQDQYDELQSSILKDIKEHCL